MLGPHAAVDLGSFVDHQEVERLADEPNRTVSGPRAHYGLAAAQVRHRDAAFARVDPDDAVRHVLL